MLAHAASSSALPCPLVSRLVSRQSRLRTSVFAGKSGGFAAEVVGFELGVVIMRHCFMASAVGLLYNFGWQTFDRFLSHVVARLPAQLHIPKPLPTARDPP